MNLTTESLTEMLSRRRIPALSLAQLRDMVAHEQGYLTPCMRLRGWLRSESEGFRLLDPWLGPWRNWTTSSGSRLRGCAAPGEEDDDVDTWVIPRRTSRHAGPPRTSERIGVSIRALGLLVDEGSPALLARWVYLAQEAARWEDRPTSPPDSSLGVEPGVRAA